MLHISRASFTATLLLLINFNAGNCTTPLDLSGDEQVFEKITIDGTKLVEQLYQNASEFRDYKFDSTLYICKPVPKESGGGTYYFKRPNLVRLQIKSNGIKNGTVVVRQPDGKIRIAGGPKLHFLKMNLDPDSRMLQAPNGYNVIKSDFASLFARMKTAIAAGNKALVTSGPITLARFGQAVTVLQLVKPNNGDNEITDRIFIDPQSATPLEWDNFRDGNRQSITVFENFTPNLGLQDDQFTL